MYILAGNAITCELLMMKFQRQRRTKFSLVQEPLSKKIKDAMNVAVISTLARVRNWAILAKLMSEMRT